ncbi:MAG: diguanylate cyclase domain-containing protein [Anaerofustis sp.]
MNFLSAITIINAYSFFLIGASILRQNPKSILNRLAAVVNLCFMIWCISDAFFYHAPNSHNAMIWHKIGSVGWIFIMAFALHFFYLLAGKSISIGRLQCNWMLYLPPAILMIGTLVSPNSPIAKDLVQSSLGLGWTYVTNVRSFLFWFFTAYIIAYLIIGLVQTYAWARRSGRMRLNIQAKIIVVIDIVMIVIGFSTDVILPTFTTAVPPLLNIISISWGIAFFLMAKTYKLLDVYDIVTPQLLMDTVMDPIILISPEGFIMMINHAGERMLGFCAEELIGREFCEILKNRKYNTKLISILAEKKSVSDAEIELTDKNGTVIHTNASLSIAENKMDGLIGIVISLHDVSEYKAGLQYWKEMANYDRLTGLPNRRLLMARLHAAIDDYIKFCRHFSLAVIDLDRFKMMNDTYGHDFGDRILVLFSEKVKHCIRKEEIFSRIGGDEFVLLQQNVGSVKESLDLIHRVKREFRTPIEIDGIVIQIDFSVGMGNCPHDGTDSEELFRIADQRMYLDKRAKVIGKKWKTMHREKYSQD